MHRHDQRYVRQVRPAAKGIVQHDHIAGVKIAVLDRRRNRHRHRSQMHRHVIAHGDYLAAGVEDRT